MTLSQARINTLKISLNSELFKFYFYVFQLIDANLISYLKIIRNNKNKHYAEITILKIKCYVDINFKTIEVIYLGLGFGFWKQAKSWQIS